MKSGTYQTHPQVARVLFGQAAEEAIEPELDRLGASRVLVATGRTVSGTSYFRALTARLGGRLVDVFTGFSANTPITSVLEATEVARTQKADAILAVGGGSVLDGAKVTSVALRRGFKSAEDLLAGHRGIARQDSSSALRGLVAVPTTLAGAEFTTFAGVSDPAQGRKYPVDDPEMAPDAVILDPRATLDTPAELLFPTGIRAVDHCVEAYCSARPSPYADALALEGLTYLSEFLPRVVSEPDSLEARSGCLVGAWLAISAVATGVPVGASHAIGRVIAALCGVPQGQTSCILLPAALAWNAAHGDSRQARIARLLGGESAATGVAGLVARLGQPTRLREVGVAASRFPEIAERSLEMLQHHSVSGNSRPVRTAGDVIEILELAA